MDRVRVAVQASDPVTLVGATSLLRNHPRMCILDDPDRERADVLVVAEEALTDEMIADIRDACRKSEHLDGPYVVAVVEQFRDSDLLAVIDCNVVAVLARRQTGGAELTSTVLGAAKGIANLSPRLQTALVAHTRRMRREILEPNGLTVSGLASRECDVLRLVAEGLGTDEIAVRLAWSERTVKNILYGLMTRCGLNNRAHAVAYAMRAGAI